MTGKLALLLGSTLLGLTLAWWLWPAVIAPPDGDRPDTYEVRGPQPGDLAPDLVDVADNVRYYGLPVDLEYHFSTNHLGFRGPEPTPGGAPRILILGDSFAFGMGVDDGDTFPDRLRLALKTRWPDVVVYNAASPGYTITDHLEQFGDRLKSLPVDLVLLCHTASDLKEIARPVSFRRFLGYDDEDPARSDPEVAALIARAGGEKAEAVRRFWMFSAASLQRRLGRPGTPSLAQLQQAYTDGVLALNRAVVATGAQFGVVLWVEGYGMAGATVAPLVSALKAAGIPAFRASRAMAHQGEVPQDALTLPDDHFSALGNGLTARQTAAWLQTEFGASLSP